MPSSKRKSKFAKVFLISLAVLFCLIFIGLFVVSEVVVPAKVRDYVREFFEDTGFKIEIKDVGFGLLSGLKGEEIEVYDLPGLANPILTVGEVVARPEILSSLLDWKIKIRIAIDKPFFSFNKSELDKLVELIKKKKEERETAEKEAFPVEVEYLEINDARVQTPFGDPVVVKKVEIEMGDADGEKKETVGFSGLASFRNNVIKFGGKVKPFRSVPVGRLEIIAPGLDTAFLPDVRAFPEKLAVSSDISFKIEDTITSRGVINFKPTGDGGAKYLAGRAEYEAGYDRSSDVVIVDSASLNLNELFRVLLAGRIEGVRTERAFDLEGEVENIKLANISTWLGDVSPVRFSGDVEPIDFQITGSKEDENIALNGEIVVRGVDVEDDEEGFQIDGLGGEFDFRKVFQGGAFEGISARGDFVLSNTSTKVGDFKDVSGKVEFVSSKDQEGKTLSVSSLKAFFLDGLISGDARLRMADGKKVLSGNLQGKGLNLESIPENLVPVNLAGGLQTVSAEFTSENFENLNADLSFTVDDLKVKSRDKEIVTSDGARTTNSLKLKVPSESGNRVTVEGDGLYLEKFSFNRFAVGTGNLSRLSFTLGESDNWVLDLSGTGSDFRLSDGKISIGRFQTDIRVEQNRRTFVRGNLSGTDGRFGSVSFPAVSFGFSYGDNSLQLAGLKAQVESYGGLGAGEVNVQFREPYEITFSQASFNGFDGAVTSEGARGDLAFYSENGKLDGSVFIGGAGVFKAELRNLSMQVGYSGDDLRLENISGEVLGGGLKGNVLLTDIDSSRHISSDLRLANISIPYGENPLHLGSLSFSFSGLLGEGSFPQGRGGLSFSGFRGSGGELSAPLNGGVEILTENETIRLQNGFIESERGTRINFTAEVENTLSQERSFYVQLPETDLAEIKETTSPLLPEFLKRSEVEGQVSVYLTLNRFLREGTSWDGIIFIRDASLKTDISGTSFIVKNVNGNIPILEESDTGMSLARFIENGWKLEREVFGDFLATTEKGTGLTEGLVSVGEIEYGFLKLRDIESFIKLDDDKVVLKWLESSLFDGRVFSRGVFPIGGGRYSISFLLQGISLQSFSESIKAEGYITGRVNGLFWMSGESGDMSSLDGSFNLWTVESKEPRRVGRALLQNLGVKERLLLGSSRRYNRADVYGYIADGVITFRELHLSHGFFGIKDLLIQVDRKRNSISVAHLLSVIRETARRAAEGGLQIEFEK